MDTADKVCRVLNANGWGTALGILLSSHTGASNHQLPTVTMEGARLAYAMIVGAGIAAREGG